MIQTTDLSRRYGRFIAVDGVNLTVPKGEIYGFLGLNGAGKTTVMRMICGLLRPTKGYARVGNVCVRSPGDSGHLIGKLSFVSQEMKFFEQATLSELLKIYARLIGCSTEHGLTFARQVGAQLDRPCRRLSPGQQRKAQLAIALLKDPEYLLLDEPTAGLDPIGVAEIRQVLQSLHSRGTTIIFSSHVLGEVQNLCTRIGILHHGSLRYEAGVVESYGIQVDGNASRAEAVLRQANIPVRIAGENRVIVEGKQVELAPVIECLTSHGIRTGVVQAIHLEDIFTGVVASNPAERNQ